jgi:CBS domain-containing protein
MRGTVASVMSTSVITAHPSTPFHKLVELLQQHRISALPVVDDAGRLVGIVSEADLLVKAGYPSGVADASLLEALRRHSQLAKARGVTAGEIMTTKVVTVPVGATVADAARLAIRHGVKRLPVLDADGKLVGIVTRGDLLRVFLAPEESIEWEVSHKLLQGWLGLPRDQVTVRVRDGVVRLAGTLDYRSEVRALTERVNAIPGVVAVDAGQLTWRVDDLTVQPAWPIG